MTLSAPVADLSQDEEHALELLDRRILAALEREDGTEIHQGVGFVLQVPTLAGEREPAFVLLTGFLVSAQRREHDP